MSTKFSFWTTAPGFTVLLAIALIGYWLLQNHSTHLIQWLPFSILLLCPLMHIFMHRGHGGKDHDATEHSDADYDKGHADAVRYQQQSSNSERQQDGSD